MNDNFEIKKLNNRIQYLENLVKLQEEEINMLRDSNNKLIEDLTFYYSYEEERKERNEMNDEYDECDECETYDEYETYDNNDEKEIDNLVIEVNELRRENDELKSQLHQQNNNEPVPPPETGIKISLSNLEKNRQVMMEIKPTKPHDLICIEKVDGLIKSVIYYKDEEETELFNVEYDDKLNLYKINGESHEFTF